MSKKLIRFFFYFSLFSHAIIGWPASIFRTDPVDVLCGILDVTSLAMDAVLSIDHQSHPLLAIFPGDKLIHSSRAVSAFRTGKLIKIRLDGHVIIFKGQVGRLVTLVVCIYELQVRKIGFFIFNFLILHHHQHQQQHYQKQQQQQQLAATTNTYGIAVAAATITTKI